MCALPFISFVCQIICLRVRSSVQYLHGMRTLRLWLKNSQNWTNLINWFKIDQISKTWRRIQFAFILPLSFIHSFIYTFIYPSWSSYGHIHSTFIYSTNQSSTMHLVSVGNCQSCSEDTHTQIHKHTQRDTHRRAKTPICFSFDFILSITEYLRWNFLMFSDLFLRTLFYFISFYWFFQQFFVDGHNYFEVFLQYKNKDNITTDLLFILFTLCRSIIKCRLRTVNRTSTQCSIIQYIWICSCIVKWSMISTLPSHL